MTKQTVKYAVQPDDRCLTQATRSGVQFTWRTEEDQQYIGKIVKTDEAGSTVTTDLGAVSQLLATPRDAEGVGAVLNDGEAVLVADLVEAVHVTDLR